MVLLVWLHVLAAVSWIGGMIFLSVVLVPVLKHEPYASQKALLFRTVARRFRVMVWGAITILLLIGPPLLHQRGIPIMDPSGWPMVLSVKLGLVAILFDSRSHHRASCGADIADPHGESDRVRSHHSCIVPLDRSLLAPPDAGRLVCRSCACADIGPGSFGLSGLSG
jgi:putative copper resistance protein D